MESGPDIQACPGAALAETVSNALYLRIHYTADPTKRDPEFKGKGIEDKGLSWWLREMEMSEDVYSGEAVFKDFDYDRHCPPIVRERSIPIYPKSTFFAGWDTGQTHQHAVAVAMVTPMGQCLWIMEVVPSEGCSLSTFAPVALQKIKERLPADWMNVVHVADPASKQRAGTDFSSACDILNDLGVCLNPARSQSPQIREDAVNWLLNRKIDIGDGKYLEGVIYGAKDCPVLVDGMKGAYCLEQAKNNPGGLNLVLRRPAKNFFSHCNDGHQYAAMEVKAYLQYDDGEVNQQWMNS